MDLYLPQKQKLEVLKNNIPPRREYIKYYLPAVKDDFNKKPSLIKMVYNVKLVTNDYLKDQAFSNFHDIIEDI